MANLILLKQRRQGVTDDDFRKHLLGERLELIRQLDGLKGYSAQIPVEDSESLFPEESIYDSIEQLQFDSIDQMQRALESEIAEEAHSLGQEYIDFENEIHLITDERVSLPGSEL